MKNSVSDCPSQSKFKREDDPELRETEDVVNYLVDAYKQTGEPEYRDNLLDCFEGYFVKYVVLFSRGEKGLDINNKDTMNFLRMFMNKEEKANRYSYEKTAGRIIHRIRRVLKSYTREDLYQEIVTNFLDLLERYQSITYVRKGVSSRISFAHYIQAHFRYRFYQLVASSGKDIITGSDWVEYNDELHETPVFRENEDPGVGIGVSLDKWVWGKETSPLFSTLTDSERYLLWLKYESEPSGRALNMVDLGKMMGFHHQSIVRMMEKIKKKLKKAMKDDK